MRSQLTAEVDTTIVALRHLLLRLAWDPAQYGLRRGEPGLVRKAFNETLRHLSPLQQLFRTAIQPGEVGGAPIQADTKMLISIAAANRDPRK